MIELQLNRGFYSFLFPPPPAPILQQNIEIFWCSKYITFFVHIIKIPKKLIYLFQFLQKLRVSMESGHCTFYSELTMWLAHGLPVVRTLGLLVVRRVLVEVVPPIVSLYRLKRGYAKQFTNNLSNLYLQILYKIFIKLFLLLYCVFEGYCLVKSPISYS